MTNEHADPETLLDCLSCGLIAQPDIKMGGLVCPECREILVFPKHPLYREIRDKLIAEREQQD